MPKAGYTSLVNLNGETYLYHAPQRVAYLQPIATPHIAIADYSPFVVPEIEFELAETIYETLPTYYVYTPYGFKLSLGGFVKGIGHAIHGVVKGVGRVVHYGVKFLLVHTSQCWHIEALYSMLKSGGSKSEKIVFPYHLSSPFSSIKSGSGNGSV
jgi:hypothetical protein